MLQSFKDSLEVDPDAAGVAACVALSWASTVLVNNAANDERHALDRVTPE